MSNGYVTFLSLGRYGRFANQLFQIAGTIGIARKNNMEPVFPLWINHDHKDRFGSKEDVELYNHLINPLPSVYKVVKDFSEFRLEIAVPWGYHDIRLTPGHNYNLSGHMQSMKYFEHCIDEVRERLKFKNEFPRNKCVAIHVRRGDYDDKYHPRLGLDYYHKAMQQFSSDTVFQVFSDDIVAVHDEFETLQSNNFRFVNYDEPMYDYIQSFNLMKSCSGFIIGNSSYSAMAAILNDKPGKKVIAPKLWFGSEYAAINANDVYCKDWIVI